MNVPTHISLDPKAAEFSAALSALPAKSGIYILNTAGNAPYISWSANIPRRLNHRLLFPPSSHSGSRFQALRESLVGIQCWPAVSKLETSLLLYELIKSHYPGDYMRRLKLRTPWFLNLTASDPFPRLTITNRISRSASVVLGPFASRDAAQLYEQRVSPLFQIRRCSEVLVPAPDHPGCIYGEMNQCLRPCQGVVSVEEYATEANRVADLLSTNGRSTSTALSAARERAAEAMDFEQAAQIHKRFERIQAASAARNEVVVPLENLNGVALACTPERSRLRLYALCQGFWQDPLDLDFSNLDAVGKSLDQELREKLTAALGSPSRLGNRLEQVAVFSRWYYSSWRNEPWFPFRTLTDLNYRKLVRSISSLMKSGPTNTVPASPC